MLSKCGNKESQLATEDGRPNYAISAITVTWRPMRDRSGEWSRDRSRLLHSPAPPNYRLQLVTPVRLNIVNKAVESSRQLSQVTRLYALGAMPVSIALPGTPRCSPELSIDER